MKRTHRMVTMLAAALLPALAAAHAHLQESTPADGSVIGAAPHELTLMFSETAHLTQLTVQRQGDAQARAIDRPVNAARHLTIALPRLVPGVYTIRYRVVSTDDGHITSGAIRFTVTGSGANRATFPGQPLPGQP